MRSSSYGRYRGSKRRINRSDLEPTFKGVSLLVSHAKPLTLLGVSPKSILSDGEFKQMRSEVWRRAQSHCEACGIYVRCDSVEWGLRLHDNYIVDYKAQTFNFDKYYALCESCYLFINRHFIGDEVTFNRFVSRGNLLLERFGLSRFDDFDIGVVYIISFRGFRYINDFYPNVALRAFSRGVRVIPRQEKVFVLPVDSYYHKPVG